jgi:hypothetical protein
LSRTTFQSFGRCVFGLTLVFGLTTVLLLMTALMTRKGLQSVAYRGICRQSVLVTTFLSRLIMRAFTRGNAGVVGLLLLVSGPLGYLAIILENEMKRLTLALFAATLAFAATGPAKADYTIVQWSYGDCKIWDSSIGLLAKPEGSGWTVLSPKIATYDAAYTALQALYTKGVCK